MRSSRLIEEIRSRAIAREVFWFLFFFKSRYTPKVTHKFNHTERRKSFLSVRTLSQKRGKERPAISKSLRFGSFDYPLPLHTIILLRLTPPASNNYKEERHGAVSLVFGCEKLPSNMSPCRGIEYATKSGATHLVLCRGDRRKVPALTDTVGLGIKEPEPRALPHIHQFCRHRLLKSSSQSQ